MARPPRLLAISDRRTLGAARWTPWLQALAEAGIDGVQVREKDLDDRALLGLTAGARDTLGGRLRLLVNGRADIALAAGADGVHLPADGVPVELLRRRFGPELLIGCSTHHPDEVAAAREAGADYVTFGPVFATPSKRRFGAPPGLAGLRRAAAHGLPVLALGGIGCDQLAPVADAGAAGAAGIRAFQDPALLPRLVAAGRRLWTFGTPAPPAPASRVPCG